MSVRPVPVAARPYAVNRYPTYRQTFIPRPPVAGGPGAGLGRGAGGIGAIIGGIAAPLLCLGCLSTLALLGLFGTMIGAAAYMNGIQKQYRKALEGSFGSIIESNIVVLFLALFCSMYLLFKNRRGVASA